MRVDTALGYLWKYWRCWRLRGDLGEGAATDRREIVGIGIRTGLRRAVTVRGFAASFLFAEAAGPHERERALELVAVEVEFQLACCQSRLA